MSPYEFENVLDVTADDPWNDALIGYNTNNFNNIGQSIVLIFEALTLEGWSTQFQNLNRSGDDVMHYIFLLILIFFGSYFIINLILAVIMGSFTKFENKEIEGNM